MKWMGTTPVKCGCCTRDPKKFFVDGKTRFGPWAIMCEECFPQFGRGLGDGRGQKYDAQTLEKIGG
jgi:hypothetical protein